ncbi:MAG TPA: Ig-like domain-containing protein [Candidatus Saccharimonadia bacterium]|nr:Ig-like domain-containing protein [Patescibacteria group bacterium]HZZ98535.1 Ig-like domain-containing protein [Candidatus Saccharimonadia bacterium]
MNLSKLLSKRIPTILGLLFLGSGLAVGVFLLSTGTGGFFPRASPETTPKQMKITNVSNDSFTVSFLTDTTTPGFIKYSTDASRLTTQAGDDRDQISGSIGQFTTHHITVRGLDASATYYFSIGTANNFAYTDGNKPYSVKTAAKIGGAPNALTAYGTVVQSGGSPAKDAIVYMTVDGGSPLSTLVKSSGSYAVSLALARTTDLSSFASLDDNVKINILVQGPSASQTSNATTIVKNTQPVPTITLGQNQDFTADTAGGTTTGTGAGDQSTTQTATDTSSFSQQALNAPTENNLSASGTASGSGVSEGAGGDIVFANPATDGQTFTTLQPTIKGSAPAITTLTITIHSSQVVNGTVTTDSNGNWSFTPPAGLDPGSHTITVSYTDSAGVVHTEQRTFLVSAGTSAGNNGLPAFSASPSATPKPTPTPTASASARVSVPSTSSGIPKSGTVEPTYLMLIFGFVFLAAGFVLWHKTARSERVLDGRN